jgi:hypothetical protein
MSRRKHYHFRALGFIEDDGRWGALCLETSFIGYGTTFEAALVDLVDATECAIEGVRRMGWPDSSMGGPAPRRYVAMWKRAMSNAKRPAAAFQVDASLAAA